MNVAQFVQLLGRTKPHAVYLLVGPESFLRRQVLTQLLDQYVSPPARGFNYSVFGDSIDEVQEALVVSRTWPMQNSYRLVLLRGQQLNARAAGEKLADYLDHPSNRTLLVLELEEFKKEGLLPELGKTYGVQVDCLPLKGFELTQWVQNYTRAGGYQMAADAAKLLVWRVGNSLQEIVANLEKLFDWVGEPGRITLQHVQEAVGETRDLPLWELSDGVMAGDASKALVTLDACFRGGEAPLVLLSVITKVFRQVIVARELREAGASNAVIGRALRIPDFKVNDFVRRLDALPPSWGRQLLPMAAELDNRMKSMPAPPRLWLEALACRACESSQTAGFRAPERAR